ncbi:Serine--tRNA ligase, cytoplasmic [Rozella allomycis CSF55]|uniref:serine--tRNA ligase n=1 Tax=Rozella allomycis (strain CSF55) TaxID=988480 RepID=A0A075AYU2_ROZAC|nr:Serine--tRNA ligase, cytoplasmic [Rozella allomycis CSF55]|eukprot:EPZ35294.1 Serine--tRNA ligase, cytoplasmic [Rozella allomycis CSF55]
MLDRNLFRAECGGNPELIRVSQRKRGASPQVVDEIIEDIKNWVAADFAVSQMNKEINKIQKEIGQKKKNKENADDLIQQKSDLEKQKEGLCQEERRVYQQMEEKIINVGNIVHPSVVDSLDEAKNKIERLYPENEVPVKNEKLLYHFEVLKKLDGFDTDRGVKVVGHRGYFLKNWGVRLNQALINYATDFLFQKQYTLLQTPFMMKRDMMAKTAQLSQFDEELYKVSGDGEDKYLIATSEQPISVFHANEWLDPKELPLRYGGYSTCFRKEAGAHGKDVAGIFRIHQFEKVEQFCITEPEKSWDMFDEMIKTSEEFYKSLDLKFRVVSIVSGALNNAAAKKYDLEAWFPRFGEYRELVSCSNCTDYQSRRLEIRCGEKKYVHCLNSTLCATERTLCCILENYQTETGLNVPTVLRPYLGGIKFIPYLK